MEVKKLFNITKEKIESKKFNIFIGISLGNKWFTKENLREYLNWALENTKGKILFLIADEIQAINYSIRDKRTLEASMRKSKRYGKKIKRVLEKLISEQTKQKQSKIKIFGWEEYKEKDEFYKQCFRVIKNEFEKDENFKKEILDLLRRSISDKKFSKKEYLNFSDYLLEEFTAMYSGIKINSNYYGLQIYPKNDLIWGFIEKIQQGQTFLELSKKLPKEKVALAILN